VSDIYYFCKVTAHGSTGDSVAVPSNVIGPITEMPSNIPTNTTAPVVTGTAQTEAILTCSTGAWANSPSFYSYQWFEQIAGGDVLTSEIGETLETETDEPLLTGTGDTPVSGQTASTFIVPGDAVANYYYCKVTAHNALGASVAVPSNVIGPITAGGGGSWVDAVNVTLAGSSAGWETYNMRQVFAASVVAAVSGSKVKVTLKAGAADVNISNSYIGHQAASGDVIDFDGAQVQIKVGGTGVFTIPSGASVVSDELVFAFTSGKGVVVAMFFGASASIAINNAPPAGHETHYATGSDQSAVTNVVIGDYANYGAPTIGMVQRIEVSS
jgi:hypothetical protein